MVVSTGLPAGRSTAGSPIRIATRGCGQREQGDGGHAAPDHRPRDDPPRQRGPDPRRPGGGAPAAEERDPAPVGPRPEPGQQRGQHGQRAQHRGADHRDRAERHAAEHVVAGQEQPRQRDHDGQPGHHDRPARGRGGDPQGLGGAVPGGPLLALAAQVEQRVVDADRHPDEQHHLGGAGPDRQPVADQR